MRFSIPIAPELNPKRAHAVATKVTDFCKSHVVWMVLASLTFVWFIVSILVYYAERGASDANIKTLADAIWWGIVTLLTVGYGDRFPVTTHGRLLASLLMCSGVVAMSVVTAKVSSILLERALLEGRGFVDKDKLNNHFIVCGWKDDMAELLEHIIDHNHELNAEHVLLIANVHQSAIDDLHANEKLKRVKVIIGNAFQHTTLERANPKKARRVLILADRSPDEAGRVPNEAEADARTIMTAITLSNIARGTLITAEILDPKLDHYLEMAGVSDIIYSREYSRLLLGNASTDTGLSNIIHDLLNPAAPSFISTIAIPDNFTNKTYKEFKLEFESKNQEAQVVGVLENTGNPQRMKEKAIRDAQKTASVQGLIKNLQTVKSMRCNNPVFLPSYDYVIPVGAAAIVIENRRQKASGQSTKNAA